MQVNPKNTGHQNTKECQVGVEWKQQRETAVTSALASPWGSIGTGGGVMFIRFAMVVSFRNVPLVLSQ